MTHGDEIHATIGFRHRVILFFLSLIPSPQFSPLLRFRQLPLLPPPPPSPLSSLSTQSVNPRRNVLSSIAIPVRSSSAAKWTKTTTQGAKGLVKSISMDEDMVEPNPACPLVSGSALIAPTSSRSLTLSRPLVMSLLPQSLWSYQVCLKTAGCWNVTQY